MSLDGSSGCQSIQGQRQLPLGIQISNPDNLGIIATVANVDKQFLSNPRLIGSSFGIKKGHIIVGLQDGLAKSTHALPTTGKEGA